jgi:hypothetical protein
MIFVSLIMLAMGRMKVEVMAWIRLINSERFVAERNLVPGFGESELRLGLPVRSPSHVLARILSIAASWIRARFSYSPSRSLRIFDISRPSDLSHTITCVPAFLHLTAHERLLHYITLVPGGIRRLSKILFRSKQSGTLACSIQHGFVC